MTDRSLEPTAHPASARPRDAVLLALFAPAHCLAVALGYAFYFTADSVSAMWPSNGLAMVFFGWVRPRWWPLLAAILIACELGIGWTYGMPLKPLGIMVSGNLVEVLLGALVLRRFAGPALFSARDPYRTLAGWLGAAFGPTALGAMIGAAGMASAVDGARFGEVWQVWYLSDALGVLVTVPLLVALTIRTPHAPRAGPVERTAYLVVLFAVTNAVTGARIQQLGDVLDLGYVLFPLLLIGTLRLRVYELAAALTGIALLTVWHADQGRGPFLLIEADSVRVRIVNVQAFLISLLGSAIWLRATLNRMEAVQQELDARERAALEADRRAAVATAAAISVHDFNNQLTVLSMSSDLLRRKLEGDDASHHLVREQITAIEQAADIVSQVMRLARPDDNRTASLAGILERQRRMLSRAARGGADSRVDGQPPERPIALSETDLIRMLLNLLTNAAHATTEGDTITLRVADDDDGVTIEVEDTGTGMPPDVAARVFDPFFTTKGDRGTGLGLAGVHTAVRAVGGSIQVRSEEGRGTTFTVRVPWAE